MNSSHGTYHRRPEKRGRQLALGSVYPRWAGSIAAVSGEARVDCPTPVVERIESAIALGNGPLLVQAGGGGSSEKGAERVKAKP